LALQMKPSNTYSINPNGSSRYVTKENHKNLKRHG
jgi:hypothetical protein